jgi:hypothetical protein
MSEPSIELFRRGGAPTRHRGDSMTEGAVAGESTACRRSGRLPGTVKAHFPKGGSVTGLPKTVETRTPVVQQEVVSEQPQVKETKTAFTAPPRHLTVVETATKDGHVVPLTPRAKADPLLGAQEAPSVKVSDKIPTPTRPPGYSPRALWQEIIVMGTGHDDARKLIGQTELVTKLKNIGFDVSVATEWRDFFHGIDRVSTEKGKPNPSAKGRAEFADWVVVQLGGASAGFWKGAA